MFQWPILGYVQGEIAKNRMSFKRIFCGHCYFIHYNSRRFGKALLHRPLITASTFIEWHQYLWCFTKFHEQEPNGACCRSAKVPASSLFSEKLLLGMCTAPKPSLCPDKSTQIGAQLFQWPFEDTPTQLLTVTILLHFHLFMKYLIHVNGGIQPAMAWGEAGLYNAIWIISGRVLSPPPSQGTR